MAKEESNLNVRSSVNGTFVDSMGNKLSPIGVALEAKSKEIKGQTRSRIASPLSRSKLNIIISIFKKDYNKFGLKIHYSLKQ